MVPFKKIKAQVCEEFNITVEEFESKSRKPLFVLARQKAWWMGHEEGYSYPQLGRMSGDRDHSTVIHGVEMERYRRTGDPGWYLKRRQQRFLSDATKAPSALQRDPVAHAAKVVATAKDGKPPRKIPAKARPKIIKPMYRVA